MMLELTWGTDEVDFDELARIYISISELFSLKDVYEIDQEESK